MSQGTRLWLVVLNDIIGTAIIGPDLICADTVVEAVTFFLDHRLNFKEAGRIGVKFVGWAAPGIQRGAVHNGPIPSNFNFP